MRDEPAQEETLKECLRELIDIRQLSRGYRGTLVNFEDDIDDASSSIKRKNKEVRESTKSLKQFRKETSKFNVGRIVGNTLTQITDMVVMAGIEGIELSEITSSLRRMMPDITAPIIDAFTSMVKQLESKFDVFTNVSKTGIMLGDSVHNMSSTIAGLGISLREYESILTKNASKLSDFGSTTDAAKKAINAASIAYDQNKNLLMRYGIAYEEQFDGFMKFFGSNAYMMRIQNLEQQQVVDLSRDYAIELRKMADLTGQDVDAMQEQINQMNADKSFKALMASMGADQKAGMELLMGALKDAGPGIQEFVKSAASGLPPVTEAGQLFAATSGAMAEQLHNLVRNIMSGGKLGEKDLAKQLNDIANSNQSYIKQNAQLGTTLMQTGSPLGQVFSDTTGFLMQFGGSLKDLPGKTDEATRGMINMKDALNALREKFTEISDYLQTKIISLLGNSLIPMLDQLLVDMESINWEEKFDSFITWLKQTWDRYNPFNERGRANMLGDWNKLLNGIMRAINDKLGVDVFDETKMDAGEALTELWNSKTTNEWKSRIGIDSIEGLAKGLVDNKSAEYQKLVTAIEYGSLKADDLNKITGLLTEFSLNKTNVIGATAGGAALGSVIPGLGTVSGGIILGGGEAGRQWMNHLRATWNAPEFATPRERTQTHRSPAETQIMIDEMTKNLKEAYKLNDDQTNRLASELRAALQQEIGGNSGKSLIQVLTEWGDKHATADATR